jgi:hypothetical protein
LVHEADQPGLVVGLFDADFLAGEDLAEIDLVTVEADAPACGDGYGLVMERVADVGQALDPPPLNWSTAYD